MFNIGQTIKSPTTKNLYVVVKKTFDGVIVNPLSGEFKDEPFEVRNSALVYYRPAEFPQVRYFASRKNKFVEITHAPEWNGVSTKVTKPVSGKVEARQIVKELNGVAWNF